MSLLAGDDRLLDGVPIPKNNIGEIILRRFEASKPTIVSIKGYNQHYEIVGWKKDESQNEY